MATIFTMNNNHLRHFSLLCNSRLNVFGFLDMLSFGKLKGIFSFALLWYLTHPSLLWCLSKAGSHWQQAKVGSPDIPLPTNAFQLLLGDPEAFLSQARYVISPVYSGSNPGSSMSSKTCLENLHRKAPRRHPYESCIHNFTYCKSATALAPIL